jgi:hypothetical protein
VITDQTSTGPGIIDAMSSATELIGQALEQADALPPGHARIDRLDGLLADLDQVVVPAEDDFLGRNPTADQVSRLAVSIRVALIPACLIGGEHQRVPDLLGWLFEGYDETAAWFSAPLRRSVLKAAGQACVGLLQHPDIPLWLIEQIVAETAQRCEATSESMTAVLRARYHLTRHLHGPAAAQDAFAAWIAVPPSEMSACADCERAEQVRQLGELGRHREAVELATPLLDVHHSTGCAAQPIAIIAAVLTSLLETDQVERAAIEHVRAVRLIRALPAGADPECSIPAQHGRVDHLLVCARSDRLQRGLDLLEEWLPWYATIGPPSARLEAAAVASRLLRALAEAGHGSLRVVPGGNPDVPPRRAPATPPAEATTVDELGARLESEARDLSARFDARNDTSAASDLVQRILEAPALPQLPLDELVRSAGLARVSPPRRRTELGRRRRAGRDVVYQPSPAADDLRALAEAFDQALAADAQAARNAVLDVWRSVRSAPIAPHDAAAAARLDGWLTVEELALSVSERPAQQQTALAAAALATDRLHAAGLAVEGLLHEQACVLSAAQSARIDPSVALRRIEQLAIEVSRNGGPGDTGVALSRLVLAREVAATAGHPGTDEPRVDPLDAGLAALNSVPAEELDHQQLRALCRLLRLRSIDEPNPAAIDTLFEAVAVLPDGVRPLERALAGADLATALQESDPPAALTAWEHAIADAETAAATQVLGNLLAASATLRHGLGDPGQAAEDLSRAIPLLDAHASVALAAQARVDLARALLALDEPFGSAESAESALADVTELLRGEGVELGPAPEPGALEAAGADADSDVSADVHTQAHLAGCAAFAAAEATAVSGDRLRAHLLATRSAHWHRYIGNPIAEAEAWQLAARFGGSPADVAADLERAAGLAEAGGDWGRAATCRRERVTALKDAEGMEAALAALADADAALGARVQSTAGRHVAEEQQQLAYRQLRWHRLAVAEERARLLAVSGRFQEAMAEVDGLEDEYVELGDAWSARDLMGLRGQLRAELDDLDGALADLHRAAEAAQTAGDLDQAHGLGERLAAVLDLAGRPDEAELAWQRYCRESALA